MLSPTHPPPTFAAVTSTLLGPCMLSLFSLIHSKLLERAARARLEMFLDCSDLMPMMQSAYCRFHSTETAILKIYNDLLLAADNGDVSTLCLLDLTAPSTPSTMISWCSNLSASLAARRRLSARSDNLLGPESAASRVVTCLQHFFTGCVSSDVSDDHATRTQRLHLLMHSWPPEWISAMPYLSQPWSRSPTLCSVLWTLLHASSVKQESSTTAWLRSCITTYTGSMWQIE